jgi:hypothetical protein
MSYLGWATLIIWVIVFFGVPIYLDRAYGAVRRRRIDATRRTEKLNGHEYSVYTLTHPVLREKSTGRLGIALEHGLESDLTTISGKMVSQPKWMKLQFFRKSDGEPGRVEWRRFSKFEIVGTASVDYLSRRAGLLRTERLIHYNVDLASLRSATLPRRRRSAS